jgi:hypothetical protein
MPNRRHNMKSRIYLPLAPALALIGAALTMAQQTGAGRKGSPLRPEGPCDIYAAAGNPCVAAHSTTRALSASYNGLLYLSGRIETWKGSLDILCERRSNRW